MYVTDLNTNLFIDNIQYNIMVPFENTPEKTTINNIIITSKRNSYLFSLSLKNASSDTIRLNNLEIHTESVESSGYSSIILNPEYSDEAIKTKSISGIKNKETSISHLYSVITGHDEYKSLITAFLCSHSSRNYIKLVRNLNNIDIYAVYDFGSFDLLPGESIELDDLYQEYGKNYFDLLNNYATLRDKWNYANISGLSNPIEDNFLYSENPSSITLKYKNKNLYIRSHGKKLYLVDISSSFARGCIVKRYNENFNKDSQLVFIKKVKEYIKLVTKFNLFNCYYEFSRVIGLIKSEVPTLQFIFDDCPEGLASGFMSILDKKISFENRGLQGKLLSKSINLHYDFIIKTVAQRDIFKHINNFQINNSKLKQAMELITLSETMEFNENITQIKDDIDVHSPILVNMDKDNLFSIMRFGKAALYIAVFNLSKSTKRFYWDLSLTTKAQISDGIAVDIISKTNYLMAGGKIDIKHIPPMDCCFIKKPLNSPSLSKEI